MKKRIIAIEDIWDEQTNAQITMKIYDDRTWMKYAPRKFVISKGNRTRLGHIHRHNGYGYDHGWYSEYCKWSLCQKHKLYDSIKVWVDKRYYSPQYDGICKSCLRSAKRYKLKLDDLDIILGV